MKRRSFLSRFFRSTDGTALFELTLVIPLILLIGMGAIEFGNLLQKRQLIINGVRDAARYVAGLPYDPTNATSTNANIAAGQNLAARGVITGGTNRISWWAPGSVTIAYTAVPNTGGTNCGTNATDFCLRGGNSIYVVTASTSIGYGELGALTFLYNSGAIAAPTITLNATHQERVFSVR
jgi:Flp pilus assembly protein TadG